MKKLILLALLTVLAGCTTTGKQAGYQLATLELIDRGVATGEQVVDRVGEIRQALDSGQSFTFTALSELARGAVGYNDMTPQGQVLVDTLITDVRTGVGVVAGEVLTPEHREAVGQRLDWIAQTVRSYAQ